MPRIFSSVTAVLTQTAKRKAAAARARTSRASAKAEVPRQIYLRCCEEVAASLRQQGFSYAKSGPYCTKRDGDFKYQIAFQSSHNNVPGEHVALWMHAIVTAPRLKRWRSQQIAPLRQDDWVAGGAVHLLSGSATWLEWDVAEPQTRDEVVSDAVEFARTVILPFFQRFEQQESLIEFLAQEGMSSAFDASIVESALCFGSFEGAQRLLDSFVRARQIPLADIESALTRQAERIASVQPVAYAEQVAWLKSSYGLR